MTSDWTNAPWYDDFTRTTVVGQVDCFVKRVSMVWNCSRLAQFEILSRGDSVAGE